MKEIKLEVTYRCPLACVHCSSDATPSSSLEISTQDCLRILHEAADMGVEQVAFSGGEPLRWKELERAVELAAQNGLHTSVYTSGNLARIEKKLKQLAMSGLRRSVFSLFGADRVVHERITRIRGSFAKTQAAIAAATECGLEAELHFVPLANNYQELERLVSYARAAGISRISVLRFVPQGRGTLIQNHALNRMQNIELRRSIIRLRSQGNDIRTGSPYNFLMLNDQPKCSSAIDRLIIGPDLRIYPCDAFKQVSAEELVGTLHLSTLRGNSLVDCWENSPFLTAVREYLILDYVEPCHSCSIVAKCLSGCLAQKVIKYGQLVRRPDPMCLMGRAEEGVVG